MHIYRMSEKKTKVITVFLNPDFLKLCFQNLQKEHLNRAREQGWRSVLSSESNSSQETPKAVESPRMGGDYAVYHKALDRMHKEREDRQIQDKKPDAYMEGKPV